MAKALGRYEASEQNVGVECSGLDTPQTVTTTRAPVVQKIVDHAHMIPDSLLFIIYFSLFAGSSLAKSNMYSGPHT